MKVVAIKSIADVSSGNTPSRRKSEYWNGSIPWITTGELESGCVTASKECVTEKALKETALKLYHKGTVLIAMYGQGKTRGTAAVLGIEATVNQACAALTVHSGCSKFLFYQLQNSYHAIRRLSNTGNQENLNAEIIKNFKILWPDELEQQKIVAILSTQDKVIELKEKLLAQKQQQKKYLMQQLLTGKKRLPGFCEKWTRKQLGELFENRVEINRSDLGLLAITSTRGILPRDCLDLKDNSSEDKSKYLRICPGDIGYNTMRMWQGVSAYSEYEGIVSPAYTILAPMEGVYSRYFAYLFKTQSVIFSFYRFSQGLVDDTRNLKYENFKKISVSIPSKVAEQRAIVQILSTADHEIGLLQKSIEAEKQKKKALMQLLLTGAVRVK
ncbi:restriction endonuclease subunit S [Faecalibacterium wellingii]|uniref:Restriction endonuclease subunit S n=1 Tax=Faecalibacterium wellingii TaxID=2929491 RepID=A0ABU3TZL3_9FIRM|nr:MULTISPECIES: restriction endonuclease subunit S [Faecalibacterium]MDU8688756.1 restriction endonuclease subunit S [Faecalibacterium prausnitzii]UQK57838.1 restriction endonuclease subunit S [Faecalibacterium sp. HTF-F]